MLGIHSQNIASKKCSASNYFLVISVPCQQFQVFVFVPVSVLCNVRCFCGQQPMQWVGSSLSSSMSWLQPHPKWHLDRSSSFSRSMHLSVCSLSSQCFLCAKLRLVFWVHLSHHDMVNVTSFSGTVTHEPRTTKMNAHTTPNTHFKKSQPEKMQSWQRYALADI